MTTAILVVISSLVLVNNARFGGAILLESLAYDVALSVRQAQVYGISVARFGSNTFNVAYGMHFQTSSPTTYVFFADAITVNGVYDNGELVQSTSIDRGYSISALCATPSGIGAVESCAFTSLDTTFIRPDPDAYISANGAAGYVSARVVLISPRGDTRSVVISNNGQIAVQ